MECPRRWAVLCNLLLFLIQTANVYCQIEPLEEFSTHHQQKDLYQRDISKLLIPSSLTEKTFVTNALDERSRSLNVLSQSPPYYSQDPGGFSHSAVSSNIPNVILKPQCSISLPESSCNGVIRIPFENYANTLQTMPAGWPLLQPSNDVYSYPVNLQINPSSPTLTTQPGIFEFLSEINGGDLFQEPIALQNSCETGLPLNLHINIPSQNVPEPRITIVSAAPLPVTSANSDTVPFPQFPPPIPIIKRKSRSSLKKLLPILLIALLNDQDCCCNDCCCCCNCNSGSPIPIPFPIPIPVNNPIINNDKSSCSPLNRGHRDNEDGDDENN